MDEDEDIDIDGNDNKDFDYMDDDESTDRKKVARDKGLMSFFHSPFNHTTRNICIFGSLGCLPKLIWAEASVYSFPIRMKHSFII